MNISGMRVAITGATGFLGRYLVRAFAEAGAHVIAVVRDSQKTSLIRNFLSEVRIADLNDKEALSRAMQGADVLCSNAALFSLQARDVAKYLRTNIQGTRNVFDALVAANIKRVIHISSVAVYAGHFHRNVNEDHPQHEETKPVHAGNVYSVSKALSEQLAWRYAKRHSLELTTLRPCAIYGALDPNFTTLAKKLTNRSISILPFGMHVPFVYAGDVAMAAVRALERQESVGRAYNVTGDDHTVAKFLGSWAEAGGGRPLFSIPIPVFLTRTFSNERAERELSFRNRSFLEGLRETFRLEAQAMW